MVWITRVMILTLLSRMIFLNENEMDPTLAYATKAVSEHPGQNENLVPVNTDEMVDDGLNKILPAGKDDKKDGQLEVSSQSVALDDSSTPTQPEVSNSLNVKDETKACNNTADAQKNTEQLANFLVRKNRTRRNMLNPIEIMRVNLVPSKSQLLLLCPLPYSRAM